jgi:hypothetical protein
MPLTTEDYYQLLEQMPIMICRSNVEANMITSTNIGSILRVG